VPTFNAMPVGQAWVLGQVAVSLQRGVMCAVKTGLDMLALFSLRLAMSNANVQRATMRSCSFAVSKAVLPSTVDAAVQGSWEQRALCCRYAFTQVMLKLVEGPNFACLRRLPTCTLPIATVQVAAVIALPCTTARRVAGHASLLEIGMTISW
jgi:hypothetical protein